jgi:hypothetical protein
LLCRRTGINSHYKEFYIKAAAVYPRLCLISATVSTGEEGTPFRCRNAYDGTIHAIQYENERRFLSILTTDYVVVQIIWQQIKHYSFENEQPFFFS